MGDRPRTYKTEAVVLRRRNIGEADSIFTVFSLREGKFDAIAKGVRKARSHMRGHLEPLTCSRMLLARGRTLDVVTQAETLLPFRSLREDLERGAAAMYCAELVDRFTLDHTEDHGLYALLLALLAALDGGAPAHVARYFEVQVLAITGYDLHLDACALCSSRLPAEDTLLSPSAGGLVCHGCRGQSGGGRILEPRTVKVLRYARSASMEAFLALALGPDVLVPLQAALADVVRHTLDREPSASRYVDDVARLIRDPGRP